MSDKPHEIVKQVPELLLYEQLLSKYIGTAHSQNQPILWEYQIGVTGEESFEVSHLIDLGRTSANLILNPSNSTCRYLFILNRFGHNVPISIREFEIECKDFFPIDLFGKTYSWNTSD